MGILKKNKNIFIAGHKGMVGSAIFRKLISDGVSLENIFVKSKKELDLKNQREVYNYFKENTFSEVYLAAAKVGGIFANNEFSADFLYENLMIQNNIINSAYKTGVKKLLFLGSSCIYPKNCLEPINEKLLLTGQLEPTNEAYAIAKIAGIKLCKHYSKQYGVDYRSVMPTNLYGPGDNYHLENSHVIPGLIVRFHNAKILKNKKVNVWGTGLPKREFLYVDDLAAACVHVINLKKEVYSKSLDDNIHHMNIGYGSEISIRDLAFLIADIVGFKGEIKFDSTKPDGVFSKLLNSSIINQLGWHPNVKLREGIKMTYNDFAANN